MCPVHRSASGATDALLREGTRAYADAVMAIRVFQQTIQERCRSVLESNLQGLGPALGVDRSPGEIRNSDAPSLAEWDGQYWFVGTSVGWKEPSPRISWLEAYCGIGTEQRDAGLVCSVGIALPKIGLATAAHKSLQRVSSTAERLAIKPWKNEVWMEKTVSDDELPEFDESIEEVFGRWIALWRQVGGIENACSLP